MRSCLTGSLDRWLTRSGMRKKTLCFSPFPFKWRCSGHVEGHSPSMSAVTTASAENPWSQNQVPSS